MGAEDIINEIVVLIEKQVPIARSKLDEWMKNDDIEVQGAIYNILMDPNLYDCVSEKYDFYEYMDYILKYYSRCINENPNGEWSDSRYTAGWDLASWFKSLWGDKKHGEIAVKRIKHLLRKLYIGGDMEVRECIITAVLEHLFEEGGIKAYFVDWRDDEILQSAYSEAIEYSG